MVNIKIARANKCNGDYSLFITFDFDMKIVEVLRSLPTKYWDNDNKEWEVPVNKLGQVVNNLQDYDIDITGTYVSLEKPKAEIPAGFEFKTSPYEHQITGFNYGLQNDRWLLGDEMGLGKTKQVIDIAVAKKLAKGYKHCLIVCGVNGLKWNWMNEVHTHSDEGAYILGQKVGKNGHITIGSNQDKYNDIVNLHGNDNYFIITNVESLRDETIIDALQEACKCGLIGMIALDEAHKCKNPTSQQGKGILKLQAETMIAMTGTPLMNTPEDLYIILKWLGYEKHAFYSFKKHYCIYGGFGGYEVVGYQNLDELQDRLNEIMLRRLKDDVLDLPEKTYIDELVDMTSKQKLIYNEVTAEIKSNIDQIKMANNPLAELIRMRQATGFTGILSSSVQESAKMDRMEELVEEAVQNGKKVVIFSNWTQMTDVIYARLNKTYNVGQITGEIADNLRQSIVDEFQTGNMQVVIGTSGAMGTGITLSEGTVEIFMDEPWNMALKSQCVDRCHRIGQKHNLTIYTLMCKDTIDERIHELVEKKGAMADALVDGKVNMDKGELLDFLLS